MRNSMTRQPRTIYVTPSPLSHLWLPSPSTLDKNSWTFHNQNYFLWLSWILQLICSILGTQEKPIKPKPKLKYVTCLQNPTLLLNLTLSLNYLCPFHLSFQIVTTQVCILKDHSKGHQKSLSSSLRYSRYQICQQKTIYTLPLLQCQIHHHF